MGLGDRLEQDVQQIYSYLLNMRDEGVAVGRNVVLTGRSGAQHEIDVFYEFTRAGITHRVAVECKDRGTPVTKGQVQEFESKLRDIGNLIGVVVSRSGFQSGAETIARYNGIMTLRPDQMPSFPSLIAERLKAVVLPDETCVGEPFWIIMEVRDGNVTGSHYAGAFDDTGVPRIPLAFSKFHAERIFREAGLDSSRWAVRGLPRHALRAFLTMLELYELQGRAGAVICFLPPGAMEDAPFIGLRASRADLVREYYGEDIPSIAGR